MQSSLPNLSKASIKLINSLKLKKNRSKYNQCIIEGPKMVQELIELYPSALIKLVGTQSYWDRQDPLPNELRQKSFLCPDDTFKQLGSLETSNEVLAICSFEEIQTRIDSELSSVKTSLFLDRIQDPGNLGTILRLADWYGIHKIYASKGTVDVYNPKVIQSTMGALFRVCIEYVDLETFKSSNPQFKILTSVLDSGNSVYTYKSKDPILLVIGNESQGVSDTIKKLSDELVSIPRNRKGGAESLNAAMAASIMLSHLLINQELSSSPD